MACGSNVPGPGPRDPACGMEGLPVVGGLGLLLSWMVTNSWTGRTVSWRCATVEQGGPAERPPRPSCSDPEASDPHHGAGPLVFNLSFKS